MDERAAPDRRTRAHAALVGLVLVGVTAMPLARSRDYDSFPWSSYPMFAHHRDDSTGTIGHVVAVSDDGRRRRPIPPPFVATDEVMQAMMTVALAIRRGRAGELCRAAAARIAPDPAWAEFTWLEVAVDRYDALAYFDGDRRPLDRDPIARCRIPR